ncbi:hypothetical protein [Actinomycetospora sp. CA-084318]|uniref:hypothetical protein n=1 Tax=Actinomycetospora sp. CA-084318 TaxID=3239892 RepID=UPI003D978B73
MVRDEEWIVSSCERVGKGWRVRCTHSTELVRRTASTFSAPPEVDDVPKALEEDEG